MEELIKILENVESGVSSRITLSKEQKKVLDNFVVVYMEIASNPLIKQSGTQQAVLENLDEKWENLFEVTE